MVSSLKWVKQDSAKVVGNYAVNLIKACIEKKPDAVIAFPTGKTPLPMYEALRACTNIPWEETHLFQLDEYCLPSSGEMAFESFHAYLQRELLPVANGQFYPLSSYIQNPQQYDAELKRLGGLDMVILGIGTNGHIAFNEPGTDVDSQTRCVSLSESTRLANFGDAPGANLPTHAVTMGMSTILSAKEILLLATGTSKKEITERCLRSTDSPSHQYPASWLKTHHHVTIITDF